MAFGEWGWEWWIVIGALGAIGAAQKYLGILNKLWAFPKRVWRGVRSLVGWLNGIRWAPRHIRELQADKRREAFVRHLGLIWRCSEAGENANVPYCQACHAWGEWIQVEIQGLESDDPSHPITTVCHKSDNHNERGRRGTQHKRAAFLRATNEMEIGG